MSQTNLVSHKHSKPRPRHALSTRLWHWVSAVAVIVLFMSGLGISNAHRHLYWGDYGFDPADAWLHVIRFPAWMTIPQRYDLAESRDWHSLFAWVFALALLAMWGASLINRHFWRDIAASPREWAPGTILQEIRDHLRGRFDKDNGYNSLQKITYGIVLGILLPMMIFTGLAISPGFEPAAPWLVDLLGGRQSARSLHFLFAWGLCLFFLVHIAMVLISGPMRQIAGMITGGTRRDDAND